METKKFTTNLSYGEEGRNKLKSGADSVANAVKISLGPSGKCATIQLGDKYNTRISKDGYTISESIFLSDPMEEIGCRLMKQAARKTVAECGDGTSSATVLAQEIMRRGFEAVNNGANSTELRKGMNKAVKDIVDCVKQMAKPVGDDTKNITAIATISANNDPELGKIIADAFMKVGTDGTLSVEENIKGSETYAEIVDGFKVDSGINSHHFINNQKKQVQEFKDPYILITDRRFEKIDDIVEVLGFMIAVKTACPELLKPLVIVSDDITDEALKMLIENKDQPHIPTFGMIKAPGFGLERQLRLEDMAIILGGTYFSEENKHDLSVFSKANKEIKKINSQKHLPNDQRNASIVEVIKEYLTYFGKCDRIESNLFNTLIIGGEGDEQSIKERAEGIKSQLESAEGETKKQILKNRLAKLTCGIGVIKVGASTLAEYDEKCDLIDDSIRATKSATEEGIVEGGGLTLLNIANKIKYNPNDFDNSDQGMGYSIVMASIIKPFKQILENCGKTVNEINEIAEKVLIGGGYNAKTEQYCNDMVEEGIIDPAKVIRVSLESAVSMASTLLTTEVVISGNLSE